MEENRKSKADIVDLHRDTVYVMIAYIYFGKVTDMEDKATGLLAAAEKYNLKELKTICETYLCDTITQDNVFDLLVLADLHGASTVHKARSISS